MKAISIKQPWASLIAHGIKDIENRTWKCPQKYLGQRILIHSSKNTVKDGWKALTREQLKKVIPHKNKLYGGNEELTHSAIIGSVVIADCVQNHPSVWAEKGCWNWVLKDAVLFDKPIMNVKGKLSFWDFNMEETK